MSTVTSTNFLTSLGAGSGIDTKSLAQNLANAEITPQKDAFNTKITKAEARISGYGYIKSALADLKTAFAQLDDASDFSSLTASSTQPSALAVTTSSSAMAGSYSVEVSQLARAQRTASNTFTSKTATLNGGQAFSLKLSNSATPITVTTDTPEGVVSAINSANLGVTAQLLQTGSGLTPSYTIVVSGQSGASNAFSLKTASPIGTASTYDATAGVSFTGNPLASNVVLSYGSPETKVELVKDGNGQWVLPTGTTLPAGTTTVSLQQYGAGIGTLSFGTNLQTAADAQFKVNGLDITRSSNQVSDLIDGVTLDLYTTTNGAARIDLKRDTTSIKDKLNGLVTAYNDLETTLKELGNAKSTVTGGGSLVGDSLLQTIRAQVRRYITDDSSTPGSSIKAARDAGLSFDRNGQLTLDTTKLDTALQNNFDQVVTMFTAGTNNKSIYITTDSGVAGDAVAKIDQLLRVNGMIANRTESDTQKVDSYKTQLNNLDDRLNQIIERYTAQFSIMDNIVGQSSSLRTSLKNTFDAMNSSKN